MAKLCFQPLERFERDCGLGRDVDRVQHAIPTAEGRTAK